MNKTEFYPSVEASPDFAKLEEKILKFWKNEDLFHKSIETRDKQQNGKSNEFTFYDGPPFANGLPHYGHLLTGFVKDIFGRYQTMKGKRVERRFGWDCHGLPAEMGAEKDLGISGRLKIMDFGIDKFNNTCRTSVMKFASEWEEYVNRQARWVDFKNDYKTMDLNFMESILWAFKELHKKGYIYESMKVLPYSWACETPLSHFETRLDNSYREVADKAVTVAFTLKTKPKSIPDGFKAYKIMAWTTTPWTLPSNLALAIHKDMDYSYMVKDEVCYILARSSFKSYLKEFGLENEEGIEVATFKGAELEGLSYEPLFSYFKGHEKSFVIFDAEFVQEGDGTGVVHLAPGFGEDDQVVCEKHGIKLVCPVDNSGKFTYEVKDFEGLQVFDAIDKIIIQLKKDGAWIRTDQFIHNYPHCWRTDTPLIYKAVPSWYVEVTKFRDRMVELNQQINWIPSHIRDGLFGKWLENARDWAISRNRFWGTPIPVWRSDDPKYPRIDIYGSIEELERDFGTKITDLHRPYIDELVRANPDDPTGKSMMRRVEDVFDCWFESGSMPYAQAHYPFENKEWFEKHFPADFIVEYVAQTRGWFYTLMVLSTALFDRPPFLNCICHGVVLDEKGQKLSKRLNNYADPMEMFSKFGSDSMRFLMANSSVMRGHELLIDKDGKMVRDVTRLSIKPIWNAYNFFTLYANSDGIKAEFDLTSTNIMDRYIISKTHDLVKTVITSLDEYDTPSACHAITLYTDILNNWYIRRSRLRFWKSEKDQDKQSAYNTLYSILHIIARVAAPLMPLTMEEIYLGLVAGGKYEASSSVHLATLPDYNTIPVAHDLSEEMDRVREVCSSALFIRNNENIRVRQPLSSLKIMGKNLDKISKYLDLIKDEVNVKEVEVSSDYNEAASLVLKINFQVLGKRIPAKVKDIISASKQGVWEQKDGGIEIGGEKLLSEEFTLLLEPKDKKGSASLSTNDALVVLDLDITSELKEEGYARDIVRFIQQARKDSGLDVSDRIRLHIGGDEILVNAANSYKEYIGEQTLGDFTEILGHYSIDGEIEGLELKIRFDRGE